MKLYISKKAKKHLGAAQDVIDSAIPFFWAQFESGEIKLVDTYKELNGFGDFETNRIEFYYKDGKLCEANREYGIVDIPIKQPKKKWLEYVIGIYTVSTKRKFGRGKVTLEMIDE